MLRTTVWLAVVALQLMGVAHANAGIIVSSFGTAGQGGSVNGQTFFFGTGGNVYEVDSFLNISGSDLNGATIGTSAQLSVDPLPVGLAFNFSRSLSGDTTDLTLTYRFTNNTGGVLKDVQFFSFLDPEIDVPINDYYNETGTVVGSPGTGADDADPDSWEIDEPGYVFGDIFTNLLLGSLDNFNNVPAAFPDDVSFALGFRLGDLQPLDEATINILLSDDGDSLGSFALRHADTDPASLDTFTMSGQSFITSNAAVPEPGTFTVSFVLLGCAALSSWRTRRRTSSSKQAV